MDDVDIQRLRLERTNPTVDPKSLFPCSILSFCKLRRNLSFCYFSTLFSLGWREGGGGEGGVVARNTFCEVDFERKRTSGPKITERIEHGKRDFGDECDK